MAKSLPKPEDTDDAVILDADYEDISELTGDIDDTLSSITAEFDKDENDVTVLIKVYQIEDKTGKSDWLFNCQPEELPIMERLRDAYCDDGKRSVFQIRIYKNRKLFRRFHYSIKGAKGLIKIPDNKNDMSAILAAITQSQTAQFNQLKELMLVNKPAQSFNMMEMMTGMVALMVQMKNLLPAPSTANSNGNVDMLLRGMEVMKDFAGGGEGKETNMMDIIKELIKSPLLEKAIEGVATQIPNAVANSVPANPVNPALVKPSSTLPPQDTGASNMNIIVRGYINQLVKKASQDADPELYAAFILDNVPEKTVREYLLRDDLMTVITSVNPQAAQYAQWFNELKNNITEILADEAAENLTEKDNSTDTTDDAQHPVGATVNINEHPTG
jgi:hypothetical protein